MFNWERFLEKHFPNSERLYLEDKVEINIDCINDECPNPEKHMFVNVWSKDPKHDKRFYCHRCSISGDYKTFLSIYFGIPYAQINKDYLDHFQDLSLKRIRKELSKYSEDLHINNKDVFKKKSFNIDLPPSQLLTEHTKWTKYRNFSIDVLIALKTRICNKGYYKNRIIFPLRTMKNSSFLAYSQLNKKQIKQSKLLLSMSPNSKALKILSRKVLYPSNSMISALLFNYNRIYNKTHDKVVVVEGITDVIRSIMHGIEAVGVGKSYISLYQASLISELKTKEIIYIPDSDVTQKIINSNMERLRNVCDCEVSYRTLEEGDVDDIRNKKDYIRLLSKKRNKSITSNNLTLIK